METAESRIKLERSKRLALDRIKWRCFKKALFSTKEQKE